MTITPIEIQITLTVIVDAETANQLPGDPGSSDHEPISGLDLLLTEIADDLEQTLTDELENVGFEWSLMPAQIRCLHERATTTETW